MDIIVKNGSFVSVGILDVFESLIWTERYDKPGEFEIFTNFSVDLLTLLQTDYYLLIPNSNRVMIIESVSIKTNSESENKIIIKGRSLESILDRRIVLRQILIDGALQDGIEALLNENVIDSIYPGRNISNFVFSASSDPAITALELKAQYYSENLLDVIISLCEQNNIGFKIVLNSNNQFVFSLYSGIDRSYSQTSNSYVVFSQEFDNLIKSDFLYTTRYKKTYTLVSGDLAYLDGNGLPVRQQVWLYNVNTYDLLRREMFSDARDLSKFDEALQIEIPTIDYIEQLKLRGNSELAKNSEFTLFDGQVDLSNSYTYETDFFLGDIIQMKDVYGNTGRVQIIEMTLSENLNGSSMYPTLKTV